MNNELAKKIANELTNEDYIGMIWDTFNDFSPDEYFFIFDSFPDLTFQVFPVYQKFADVECTTMKGMLDVCVANADCTEYLTSFIVKYTANVEKIGNDYQLTFIQNAVASKGSKEIDMLAKLIFSDAKKRKLKYLFDYDDTYVLKLLSIEAMKEYFRKDDER